MKINEAVAQAMISHERAFKDVSEAQAVKIVKVTLAQIVDEIDNIDDGKVTVPGFGTFVIKQVEREKNGEKTTLKRIAVRMKPRRGGDDG